MDRDETKVIYHFTTTDELSGVPKESRSEETRQQVIDELDRVFNQLGAKGIACFHMDKSVTFDFKVMSMGYWYHFK